MKVEVKNKSQENNSVLLVDEVGVEKWFPLAERVKMQYVSLGEAEATVDMEKGVVTYLKMDKAPFVGKTKPGFVSRPKQDTQKSFRGNFGKPEPSVGSNEPEPEKKFYKTKHMVFEDLTGEELRVALDAACAKNWVIATQTHFAEGKWNAVIYYKVKPE